MSNFVLLTGILLFCLFFWAVKFHFASERLPTGMVFVSLASVINIAVFAYVIVRQGQSTLLLAPSLLLQAASGTLFLWAFSVTRDASLKLAFDSAPPGDVIRKGPYRYVRHPFYLAYILFWLGCAVATLHPLNVVLFLVLTLAYMIAAVREKRAFLSSNHRANYAAYREATRFRWTSVRRENQ